MPKFLDYAALAAPVGADVVLVLDVSDVSMSPDGTTKYLTLANLVALAAGGSTNRWVAAGEFIPRTTSGSGVNSTETATNKVNTDRLDFDAAAIEYSQVLLVLPSNWNGGAIRVHFVWTAASGSGDVVWRASGRAYANDDALDQAMGTAQTATDTFTVADDVLISAATSDITLAGTPASNAPVMIEVSRVATDGGDTLAVDASLFGILITFNH